MTASPGPSPHLEPPCPVLQFPHQWWSAPCKVQGLGMTECQCWQGTGCHGAESCNCEQWGRHRTIIHKNHPPQPTSTSKLVVREAMALPTGCIANQPSWMPSPPLPWRSDESSSKSNSTEFGPLFTHKPLGLRHSVRAAPPRSNQPAVAHAVYRSRLLANGRLVFGTHLPFILIFLHLVPILQWSMF